MTKDSEYLFKNDTNKNEINNLLKKSKPTKIEVLSFKCDYNDKEFYNNHSHGEYGFYLKNTNEETISIRFDDCLSNINDFWSFLEFLTQTNETSILYIDDDGNEQIIYIEHLKDNFIRFFVGETMEAYQKFCRNEINDYTYEDADVLFDVIIKKKTMIKQFYGQLLKMFDNWEKETNFVPWATDINIWQKDSEIIKNYLK